MKKELYDFQRKALDKIESRDNAALFWQMGAGKTVSAIQLTERETWNTPTLICLVLKSTVSQWIDELKEQTDRKVFNGYKKSKKDGIKPFIDATGRKCLVIGYDAYKAKSGAELRQYINDNAEDVSMVCDESSLIGSMTSERTRAVMKTKTKHRLLLSGTPATGGKMEAMIPTMNMLGWSITKERFLQQFCHVYEWTDPTRPWMTIPIIQGYKNIDKLREGLKEHGGSFITMEEAGVQLPATTEQIISIQTPPEYRKFMKNGIVKIGDTEIVGENNLTKMLYARQICSVYNPAKAAALEELLQQAGDEPVVIFYNWTAELYVLQKIREKLGRPMSIVNGQKKDLKEYENGTPGTVILCQYQAASMGLNLQKNARICVFYSQCLSYSDYEQAKARIHRIGQSRNCNFYNLICSDSIEEDILETLEQRKDYTEQLFTEKHGRKREVKLTDCKGAVIEGVGIFNIVSDAVSMATFAIDGNYKKIKVNKSSFRLFKHVSEEYVKTGEYDEKTGEIEVYIPENYEFESAEKWLREHDAGDLYEMAVELMEERKELAEKKQEIISSVESWYEGCYDAIYDLTKSVKNTNKYSRNRSTAEAHKLEKYWKLMGYSRGAGDEREDDFDTIRNAVIDYLREQPLEYFEDMDDPFDEDSMLDIIDDAYNYADFELPERLDRKEEWLEFVRTCPADWFDYADDPEEERENLIEMYEDWDDVVFCDFDYAVSGEYSDPYTTMRDDA